MGQFRFFNLPAYLLFRFAQRRGRFRGISKNPGGPMFYGWKIIAVSFVTHFISVGFVFYSYSVLFKALETEFGASRFGVSLGLTMMSLAMSAVAQLIGRAVDTYPIRNIMMIGAVTMALGFFCASQITALWQFYIILATFMGIGAALIGLIPTSTLVSN